MKRIFLKISDTRLECQDEHPSLLAALEAGLPDCSGVALGVDRVVMLALGAESIGEVIAFTVDRA
jgi:elongation factor P--beta-lysine ligase